MKPIVQYIISFLLYDHPDALRLIGYTRKAEEQKQFPLVIQPCEDNILLGETDHWHTNWGEDIIYRTAYCLARIEELEVWNLELGGDPHGRFLHKNSGIEEAEIDRYSFALLDRLGLPRPAQGFEEINLTHDIDFIARFRHFRGILSALKHFDIVSPTKSLKSLKNDVFYTFPWIVEQDDRLRGTVALDRCNTKSIYFVKATDGKGYDYPQYNLHGKDFQALMELLGFESHAKTRRREDVHIGLHGSYYDRDEKLKVKSEKLRLEKSLSSKISEISAYRSHYLRALSPLDYQLLADIGITDDYTLGFADRAGFRLGTTRTTYYINPQTLEVNQNLRLHPLTIMDCTLSAPQYMNLNEEEAYQECTRLIDLVKHYHGSLSLLWHNSNLTPDTYQRSLYQRLITYLCEQ